MKLTQSEIGGAIQKMDVVLGVDQPPRKGWICISCWSGGSEWFACESCNYENSVLTIKEVKKGAK